jgi:hypothetical protein
LTAAPLKPAASYADNPSGVMPPSAEHVLVRLTRGAVASSAAAFYVAAGATVVATRALLDVSRAVGRSGPRRRDGAPSAAGGRTRHTLRVIRDDFDAAWPYADRDGATHVIHHDPTTRYARAALAREFAHVLLAVVRQAPAEAVGVPVDPTARFTSPAAHTEECAAWALARAITKGEIWTGAATTYREDALAAYGVPVWARAPRVPMPTRTLLRWLAQAEQ